MSTIQRTLSKTLVLLAPAVLAACSGNLQKTLEDALPQREPEYKSSKSLPPDLSGGAINESLVVPDGAGTTYSDYANASRQSAAVQGTAAVLPEVDDVRVVRNGDERWLVIDAPPSAVWPRVREFWSKNGFIIKMEDPSIGIMETDWAENRADIPRDFIRSMLEKITTALYSAATRDKFRVRLERGAQPGTTELYLSHRGAEEVSQGDSFVWQPRPSDPELEAEMLNRLMVHLGVDKREAGRMIAERSGRDPRAHMKRDGDGSVSLSLDEDFSRAWRRTGLALDRVGFTVQDRDRSRGLYFVRYVDPLKDTETDKGWVSKLKFWADDERAPERDEYLISLIGTGAETEVVVLDREGKRETSATADRILSLLHEQLK